MGILAVDSIKSRTVAPVTITDDLNVSGVSTFTGSIVASGGVTGNITGDATGLAGGSNIGVGVLTATGVARVTDSTESTNTTTGSVIISGGVGIAKSLFVGGNVSVGGTLTYEDVQNVDSVGIVTARGGVRVPNDSGTITLGTDSDLQIYHSGSHSHIKDSGTGILSVNTNQFQLTNAADTEVIINAVENGNVALYYDNSKKFETTTSGATITGAGICTSLSVGPGIVQEDFHNYGTALTGTYIHDVVTHGMVLDSTVAASASFVINLRGDGSTTFNSLMNVGQTTVLTVYSVSSNTSYYLTDFQIDGSSINEKWNGAAAPAAATGSGTDAYTFNIMKTADATFSVYANFSNFA
jgi:hypothetical protein